MRYIFSVTLKLFDIEPRVSYTLGKLSTSDLWPNFTMVCYKSLSLCSFLCLPSGCLHFLHSSAFCFCETAILVKGPHSDRPGESHVEVFRALTCAMRIYPEVH